MLKIVLLLCVMSRINVLNYNIKKATEPESYSLNLISDVFAVYAIESEF